MSSTPHPELVTTFRAMAEVVYRRQSFEAVHLAVCQAAVRLVDGCDHASLMVRRHGRVVTAAASDDVARASDEVEREVGRGPCLDVLDEDAPHQHICADLRDGCEWPELGRRLTAELGVHGLAGFRLRQDGTKLGSLNVLSDTPGALTTASLDQATLLVAFASVGLAALHRGEEAATLRRGLESNREIGKAVGLLMAMHGIDDEQAFGMLSQVSQEMNLKLAQVAAQVIETHGPRSA